MIGAEYRRAMYDEFLVELPVYGPITREQHERNETMRYVTALWTSSLRRSLARPFMYGTGRAQ